MVYKTGIEPLIQKIDADLLILAEVNPHPRIHTAAIDAYQRDFQVIIVRDCVASKDLEHHEISLNYMDGRNARVVSLEELKEQFRYKPSATNQKHTCVIIRFLYHSKIPLSGYKKGYLFSDDSILFGLHNIN